MHGNRLPRTMKELRTIKFISYERGLVEGYKKAGQFERRIKTFRT